jgi:asparagine synthase (glutamine-hydrolysing)
MCGIAGMYTFDQEVTPSLLKRMTDIISHRGPDGEGYWINPEKTVGLGHRRLSIIDLSQEASQPMHFSDGRYSITFNGEIYNYIELREQLTKQGITFKSHSDTEVLLALYAIKKEKCLQELDGMFSFAIWDQIEKKLFCARDRFGEKPFFYHFQKGKQFVFGSEMKELWASGISRDRNERMLLNFMLSKQVSDSQYPSETFFKSILKLEPAHYLIVDKSMTLIKKRYWDIDPAITDETISDEDAIDKFRDLMLQSISMRLRSDVPVGSSLSGGLDSSTIVCAIQELFKNTDRVQKTFSARFRNFEKDEGAFMQKIIDATHVDAYFVWPDEEGMADVFKRLCFHQEEPFGGGSVFAQWKVMQLARQNDVTVLLDGQGADEILAGYPFYFPTYLNQLFKAGSAGYESELESYRKMHNPAFKGFGKEGVLASDQKKGRLSEKLKNIARPVYQAMFSSQNANVHLRRNDFLNKDFLNQFSQKDVPDNKFDGNLNEQLYRSAFTDGLQDLLRYADRNSMAHSREVRLPFLSHHLAEFVFAMPSRMKIRNGWSKYMMRKAFANILPSEIAWRVDKIGYEPPQKKWMENPRLQEMSQDSLHRLEKEKILIPNSAHSGKDLGWQAMVVANTLF